MPITFINQNLNFNLKDKLKLKRWIKLVIEQNNKKLGFLNYAFSNDDYILEVNKKFLNHDYYTDIITFDYCENNLINGDIVISVDTVRDNSTNYSQDFIKELHRVIIHGVLHLIGFDDKNEDERQEMRRQEDIALAIFDSL